MYALSMKSTPPGDLISPQPISGASSTVVNGALRCEFTRPRTPVLQKVHSLLAATARYAGFCLAS